MRRAFRVALLAATVFLLSSGYLMLNLRYFSRNLGWDEVYYSAWVDHWDAHPVYYPHHLIFTPSSVWFQRHFTALTGITNTTFIQKVKNTIVVSAGLGILLLLCYAASRRYWLSLAITMLIAFSGSLWHDATAHETAAIPGIIVNVTVLLLLFYRRIPLPGPYIVLVAALQSVAILLHQAYFLSVPSFAVVFLLSVHRSDARFSLVRNLGRTAIYALTVLLLTGGTYYYIGFVRLGLRMHDNPDGAQTVPFFESIPIRGNFVRFFYLIRARETWGGTDEDSLRDAVNGYGSSFVTSFRLDRVAQDPTQQDQPPTSAITAAFVGSVLAALILLMVPAVRRYGPVLPALLVWMALGSVFVYWWEPWYMEHWLYITVLTWALLFVVLEAALSRITYRLPRRLVYGTVCVLLFSFVLFMFQANLTSAILPATRPGAPRGVSSFAWDDRYLMDEMYRDTARDILGEEGR